MLQRVVIVNERPVPLACYIAAWRAVIAAPPGTCYSSSLCGWWSAPREEVLAQFRAGLDERISRRIPGYGSGRKWSPEWQKETMRAALDLNHPRLRIYWLPEWLKVRFAHRLASAHD